MTAIRKTYRDGRWGQLHLRLTLPEPADRANAAPPPLVLLHQTPKSGWIWEPMFPHFPDRAVIAPDTPGYGASDAPSAPFAIDDVADEMAGLVRTLQDGNLLPGGQIDIMGYHTGSVTALALARRHPALVRRIVCTSLPLYDRADRVARLAALPECPTLDENGSHLLQVWNAIRVFTDHRASLAWRQASLTENLRSGPARFIGYRAVYRHDLHAELAALAHPMLLLNPHDDLFDQTRSARTHAPDCAYLELPGLAHGLFEIAPAMIAAAVREFLDGNTARLPFSSERRN